MTIFMVSLVSYGQATVTIEVDWNNYAEENLITLQDSSGAGLGTVCFPTNCFTSDFSNSTYDNISGPASFNVPYGTGYRLFIQDGFGDGWTNYGGGPSYVTIRVDGVFISQTFPNFTNDTTIFFDVIAPTPSLTIDNVAIDEDEGNAVFTVTHTGVNTLGTFNVDYSITGVSATEGVDYTTGSGLYTGTLTFDGIVGDTDQITVLITDDTNFEPSETYTISFTSTSDVSVDITDTATGTIVNDDNNPDTTRPYEERYTMNLKGDFLMRGNTNMTCIANCPGSPTTNNPTVVMGYIDVDADGVTVNSSSSNFTIPTGATVQWAGLYWGGMYNSSYSGITNPAGTLNIDQVKFMEPGASSYTTLNAEIRNIETTQFSGWNTFMSFAEVTNLVQTGGNGNYFVADIALATGSSLTGPHGGWTMVIVYNDPTDISRNVSVWDGFEFFGFGINDTFTVTSLLTPSSGTFETHVGYYGMDGEASNTGDFVSIDGTSLSNVLNPANNTLNGTISEYDVDVGGRNPNYGYSWGVDIDMFDATGFVPNSATEMDVVLGSSIEGIWGGVFVTSNEIAFPSVASKSFNPINISQGDESRVTITIDNPSNGVNLTNFSLTDNLPTDMVISSTPDATSSSGGTISAISGSSNFTISGISIPAGSNCVFSFDVVTLKIGDYENTISPMDTSNDQNIPFSGEYTGMLSVTPGSVITNRRITYRVKKN